MILLSPISAILAGAVGAAVLVAIYMLKLRRRPIRISSTIHWAKADADLEVNVPLRWLRAGWLFLLQACAILLLALALGRPALSGRDQRAGRIVLLIDRSASMSTLDGRGGGSRFDEAIKRAQSIVDDAFRNVSPTITVVGFASEASVVAGPTNSRREVLGALRALRPLDQPGDLGGAIRVVGAFTAEGSEDAGPADVILISDGSFADADSGSLAGGRLTLERVGPPPGSDVPNLGVVSIGARRDERRPSSVRAFARLLNASQAERSAIVRLIRGETELERRAVVVRPGSDELVAFETESPDASNFQVALSDADSLAADNTAFVHVPAARRPAILLVRPGRDSTATSENAASDFLELVLREVPSAAVLTATPEQAIVAIKSGVGASGTPFDLVVLDRADLRPWPQIPTLAFGVLPPDPDISWRAAAEAATEPATGWRRSHPLLRDLTLDAVVARPLYSTDAPLPRGVIDLARGARAPWIVLDERAEIRRLSVLFLLGESNWPLQASFPIFVAGAVDFLTSTGTAAAAIVPTTSAGVELTPSVPRSSLRCPDGSVLDVSAGPEGKVTLVAPLPLVGMYSISPSAAQGSTFGVSLLDATESAAATSDRVVIGSRAIDRAQPGRASREIWPWFVIAAGVLLVLEWVAAGMRSRLR